MIKGITQSGFNYEIEESIVDDYEILEMLETLDDDTLSLVRIVKRMLGKEQTERLKEHIRTEEGFVSTVEMTDELVDIFTNQNEIKNS